MTSPRWVSTSVFTRRSVGCASALGEARLLEAVGDAGHARVVAVQRGGELCELQRLAGLEALEGEGLFRREAELARRPDSIWPRWAKNSSSISPHASCCRVAGTRPLP